MKMTEPLNNEMELLIINYLTGSISEDELSGLQAWIKKSPENKRKFNSLRNAWLLSGYKCDTPAIDDSSQVKTQSKSYFYMKLAASWIIFLALGSLMTFLLTKKPEADQITEATGRVEFHSPLGSRSRITLPDSTQIWLNAGTTIRYDKDYGIISRTIDLDGEAFFNVHSDSRHPFIVHASELDIKALGTRFNVKAYSEEKSITATLEEGKINISVPGSEDKKGNVLLKPNESYIYHKKLTSSGNTENSPETVTEGNDNPVNPENIDYVSNVNTVLYTSWKDQRWIIEREPFTTLVPMLERRYNMKIIFQNPDIKDFKFTGTVENESIDQLLNAIKFTAPIDYSIIKDTVRLYLDQDASVEFRKVMSGKR